MAGQRVLVRARDVAILTEIFRTRSIPLNKEQLDAYGRLYQAVDKPILGEGRGHTVSSRHGEEETDQPNLQMGEMETTTAGDKSR